MVSVRLQEEFQRVPACVHHEAEFVVGEFLVFVLVELLEAGLDVGGAQSGTKRVR